MKKTNPIHEKVLQRSLLKKAPSAVPDLLLFPRMTAPVQLGTTKTVVGRTGQADVWGVWKGGIHIEIELKSIDGKLSKEQKDWKEFCLKNGIPHLVLQAWTGESIEDTIQRWLLKIISSRPINGKVVLQIGPRPSKPEPSEKKFVRFLPHVRKDLQS